MEYHLTAPLDEKTVRQLKAGDRVFLSGVVYTARDAAHARLVQALQEAKPLPFDLQGSAIYYVGPSPAAPGQVIGSAGPTSAYRMDPFAPTLIAQGERAMIGKGKRSAEVVAAMRKYGAVYLGAVGGAAALIAKTIRKAEVIAYEDLGAEAVRRLEVENMPLLVLIDCEGRNLYEEGPAAWLASQGKERD